MDFRGPGRVLWLEKSKKSVKMGSEKLRDAKNLIKRGQERLRDAEKEAKRRPKTR